MKRGFSKKRRFNYVPQNVHWHDLIADEDMGTRGDDCGVDTYLCPKNLTRAPVNYNCLPVVEEVWIRKPQSTSSCEKETICKDKRLEAGGRDGSDLWTIERSLLATT